MGVGVTTTGPYVLWALLEGEDETSRRRILPGGELGIVGHVPSRG